MQRIKSYFQTTLITFTVLIQAFWFPVVTFAEEASPATDPAATQTSQPAAEEPAPSSPPPAQEPAPTSTPTESSPPPAESTPPSQPAESSKGPRKPTGADGGTYTYNEQTGKWENGYYSWDPNTKQTTPTTEQEYSYNPSTGRWDTVEYQYNPASGKYEAVVVSHATNPAERSALAASTAAIDPLTGQPILNSNSSSSFFNGFYNSAISNSINSSAISGNAAVLQNTFGGSALSGNASAMLNLINMIQSSWSPNNGNLATFVANIDGNVVGDLKVNPGQLNNNLGLNMGAADVDVNLKVAGLIENDIDLTAKSGNATVSKNMTAGSATTGTAKAMANVVNMINSSISAGNSFLGVININGNFDGDILMPDDLMKNLISSNAPRVNIDTSNIGNSKMLADINNTTDIQNKLDLTAKSGNALVDKNTNVDGVAKTGHASTNLTVFNLTGQEIIGSNAMLVFVNVLGEWVGVITNAPAGTTSAALGNATSTNRVPLASNTVVENDSTIKNNIKVGATSGDAAVTENTNAGRATSGDTQAGANLLNIANSQLSLTDWFGVLFINVFGKWNGSFGIDTAAGNAPTAKGGASAVSNENIKVFSFVPGSGEDKKLNLQPMNMNQLQKELEKAYGQYVASAASDSDNSGNGSGASGSTSSNGQLNANQAAAVESKFTSPNWWAPAVFSLAGILLLYSEKLFGLIRYFRSRTA